MPQNVTLYNLLISCPGDVKEEVTLIESSVDEFNEYYADTLGITIKTRHWSKSSYAQSGGKPQALLNEQFVDKCDAAVAIFWTKFGSPTDEYSSGTEEEIERMLQSGKQVFMYFSDKPISPSQMNDEGYKKIQAFREKYKDRGIYFTYSSNEEFKKLFFAHLSMFFLSEKPFFGFQIFFRIVNWDDYRYFLHFSAFSALYSIKGAAVWQFSDPWAASALLPWAVP